MPGIHFPRCLQAHEGFEVNDQLKELAKQAGFTRCTPTIETNLERFGILVAQRCAEIARGVMRDEESSMNWADLTIIQEEFKRMVGGW
jgi:hypothetical protein